MSLGLGSNLLKSGIVTPGIVTDNLVLKHNYNAGAVVPVSDGALSLNGTSAYVNCGNASVLQTGDVDASYTAWVRISDTASNEYIISKRDNSNGALSLYLDGAGKLKGMTGTTTASVSTTAINDGTWHHIAFTYDKSEEDCFYYLDGVADGSDTSFTSANRDENSELFIGQVEVIHPTQYLTGYICNVGFWNKKLEIAEIKSIMWKNYAGLTTGTGSESENLVSWWNLDSKTEYDVVGTDGDLVLDETITLGNELITGFTNGSSYPYDTFTSLGRDISAAIETSGDWGGCASNSLNLTIGEWYKCTFNLQYNSGTDHIQMVFANGPSGASSHRSNNTFTSTNGENIMYFKVSATDSGAYLEIGIGEETDVINFSMTDISLKKITGNIGELL